ncbi:MAG: bifunctional oligoribonuclease/PAP phosphatase NrnA [Gemmatimonadota bacterium]|jgi:nanoRNase/pAp phosphatase (c-di-AMP/oligoRNAs hydrolase)|nr:bifunctional oligoribonuclease/PAP phosphatase NrnA [Gemmatimonadota bacterium]
MEPSRAPVLPPDHLAEQLRALLSEHEGERHLVVIQDFPDPDAISCAMAYGEIAHEFGITSDILYGGGISHPENLALVNLLEIDLVRYSDDFPLDGYSAAVFVDNQGTTTRLTDKVLAKGIPVLAVIDHHAPQEGLDPVFRDVRPVGAAAVLFTEYLASGELLQLVPGKPRHIRLATALMHGIHSETSGFLHAGETEYAAAAWLSGYADHSLLENVLCVQKSHGTMDTIRAALGERVIHGGLSIAGVGFVRWADRDAIPQAADFLLTEENVRTAVVFGIVDPRDRRESVIGSLRTSDTTLSVDAFLKAALGKDGNGRYYGGGRFRAGGFEIDLGFLAGFNSDPAQRRAKWELFERRIRESLFAAAGLDETASEVEIGTRSGSSFPDNRRGGDAGKDAH